MSPVPVARSQSDVLSVKRQDFSVSVQQPVLCPVVSPVPFVLNVRGQSQKKDGYPSLKMEPEIKSVKSVFYVDHYVSAPNVLNAHNAANAPSVGGHLQDFWQKWSLLGVNPRVVSILRDGYVLLFKCRPPLVREPLIISGYANSVRNLYLKEALQALIKKKAVERVSVRTSLAFFNRLFIVPKPNQKWRPILDLSALNKFLSVQTFKMETPETIRISLQQGEWVTSLDFSDAYFHIPVHNRSRKYLHSSYGVHWGGQRGETNGSIPGYKNPPVPRRLVDSSPHQRILPPGQPIPPRPLSGIGLDDKLKKVGVGTQTGFRVRGLQIRPHSRAGKTNPSSLGVYPTEGTIHSVQSDMSGQDFHVSDRPSNCNRETGAPRETSHETYSVAPEKSVEDPGISGNPHPKVPPSTSMVDQRDKCPGRPTAPAHASCSSDLYRRLKRRLGCSLRRLHHKRRLVCSRKQTSHKLSGIKGRFTGTKTFSTFSARKSRPSCHRQHYSCGIRQQGGRYEVRLTLYHSLTPSLLVQPEAGHPKSLTHSRPSECDCLQVVKARSGDSNGVVSPSRRYRPTFSDMAPSTGGHVCDEVQLQSGNVCVPSGHVCLPTDIPSGQGSQQTVRPFFTRGSS